MRPDFEQGFSRISPTFEYNVHSYHSPAHALIPPAVYGAQPMEPENPEIPDLTISDAEQIRLHLQALAEMRTQGESLIAELKQHAQTASKKGEAIEQSRVQVDNAKSDLDKQLAWVREVVAAVAQQSESAKPVFASLQTTDAHAKEVTEEIRRHVDKTKAEADAHLAVMRELITALGQQSEAAKLACTSVQSTDTQTKETSARATAALESLRTFVVTATETAARVEALKTKVDDAAQVAAQRSEHIEDGKIYVDKKRAEIDVILNTAQQSATNAEAQHQASRTTVENLTSLNTTAQTTKASIDANAESVAKLLQQSQEHTAISAKLAEIAKVTEEKLTAYETRLAQLDQQSADRLKIIESLLPGATSAGLASAFNKRRQQFDRSHWQLLFFASIVGLLALAILEFSFLPQVGTLNWEAFMVSLARRLPIALPLIWLAIHSSHRGALAQRIEEDYGFKETVASSFEGFRREMAELEGKAASNSVLSQLCTAVLSVVTNPPGRIYEKHRLNSTPFNALAESAGPVMKAASTVVVK